MLRWRRESEKLTRVFPYLIAVGNLFSVVSLFESYLLLLGGKLQDHSGIPLGSVKGQGVTRLFNYFKGPSSYLPMQCHSMSKSRPR